MSERIEASETTVGKLFGEDFMFTIPIYQRPLSWTEEHYDEFLDDISSALLNNLDHYFLGSILLQEKDKNLYYLVDGQQRLTAIAILFAVIRDMTSDEDLQKKLQSYIYQEEDRWKEIPAVMRIEPWDELKGEFEKYVYRKNGTRQYLVDFKQKRVKYKDEDDPRYHIYEAIYTFNERLGNQDLKDSVDDLVKYLLNRVYIVYIITKSQTSAFRLFNVLNSRGLPLDPSDLLKSENIGVIQENAERTKYARIWRGIEEDLGREELRNVIAFIRTIKMKEKARKGLYEEFQQLYEKGLLQRGLPFIDYLREIVDIHRDKVLEPELDLDPPQKNNYKVTISLMCRFVPFSDWIPPLLAFHHKFNSDTSLSDFLLKLEKKVALEWAIRLSPTERIISFNKIIGIIDKNNDQKKVIERMEIPKKKDVEKPLILTLDNPQLYSTYGGKLARYILLRVDKEFWEIENFTGYPGTVTVEHILPRNPDSNSRWLSLFNEKSREEWTNRLGNLVLLSGRKNSRARNYDFQKKKDVYFKKKGTFFRITRELESIPVWDPEALRERHERLTCTFKDLLLSD